MKHTKAPWTIERTHNTFEVARVTPKPGFETTRNIRETVFLQTDAGCLIPNPANAALIAAAPEMFEALEAYCNDSRLTMTSETLGLATEVANKMRLALKKARGEV
jgi:hypothetical protein